MLLAIVLALCTPGIVSASSGGCQDPGIPENGRRLGHDFLVGSGVSFECYDGYNLNGSAKRLCQANKKWSGRQPECEEISCGEPDIPENGDILMYGPPVLGTVVFFECLEEYKLDGADVAVCQVNGMWSSQTPICRKACSLPPLPDKGWQRGGFKHNEVGILGCYGDYVHEGMMQSRCYDGQWLPGFSKHICYAPCAIPVPTLGLVISGNDYRHGRMISFRCLEQYELSGARTSLCQNGNWTNPVPVCLSRTYEYENVSYSMEFYKSVRFSRVLGDQALSLGLGHRVYVQLTATNIQKPLFLFIQTCYATPTPDPAHRTVYSMIKQGCYLDSTLRDHSEDNSTAVRFSFQSFRFVRYGYKVFLHCSFRPCSPDSVQQECRRKDCKSNGVRRKRSYKHPKHLVAGQIRYAMQ